MGLHKVCIVNHLTKGLHGVCVETPLKRGMHEGFMYLSSKATQSKHASTGVAGNPGASPFPQLFLHYIHVQEVCNRKSVKTNLRDLV